MANLIFRVINGDTFGAAGELPDADTIKMFVGQVPKHMNETDLRELFEQFGRVYQINVLRDKVTKQSKGNVHIIPIYALNPISISFASFLWYNDEKGIG